MNDARVLGSWTHEGSENERSDLLGLFSICIAEGDNEDIGRGVTHFENFRLAAFTPRPNAAMSRDFVVIESLNALPSLQGHRVSRTFIT